MPHSPRPSPGSPEDWLLHARSDLALARSRPSNDVLLENLCFHAQQAAEKSLKAVLVARQVDFPPTHNIGTLLNLVPGNVAVPNEIQETRALTAYAVAARYPSDQEPIEDEAEYRDALRLAETVFEWAQIAIGGLTNP